MIIGFILGVLIALVVYGLAHEIFEIGNKNMYIFMSIAIMLACMFIWQASDVNYYREEISAFNSTRNIYYNSLEDEKLTGMERVQIVQMANEANREIAKQKVRVHTWWNVFIPNDIKNQYDNIELIGIKH